MIYLGDLLRVRRFSYSLVLYYSWLKYDNMQKWVIPAGLRLLSLESPSCKSGPQLASRNFDFGRVPTIMANCAWTVCAHNIVYAEYLLVFGRNLGTCLEAGSYVTSPSKKPRALSHYWASLADSISQVSQLIAGELSLACVTPLGSWLLGPSGLCFMSLFPLLILLCSLLL